jgi:DNA mismatch repair ATPase MutL
VNRDYEEAINEACKVWTAIMIIDKPEAIFVKTKVLQIMIESTLNLVLSGTKDAEEWLETLNKFENNRIMTAILSIKMKIRLHEDKEEICEQIIDTVKRIELMQDSIERNDWHIQMEELNEYFRGLNNETITIEIPQKQIPTQENLIQPLLRHQYKSEKCKSLEKCRMPENYVTKSGR